MQGLTIHVASSARSEIVRIIGLAELRGLGDPDDAEPAVLQDEHVARADLNIHSSECTLHEELVAGDLNHPAHEGLKEPSDLLDVLDSPLHVGVDLGQIPR